MKKKYNINKKNYKNKNYVWDAEAEVLIALLSNRIKELNIECKWNAICKYLNTSLLQKKYNSQCNPTHMQIQIKSKEVKNGNK